MLRGGARNTLLAAQALQEGVALEPAFEEAVGRCLALAAGPEAAQVVLAAARRGELGSAAARRGDLGSAAASQLLAHVLVAEGPAAEELLLEHRWGPGGVGMS